MAKVIAARLELDAEVIALIERIADYETPGNYITAYTVIRSLGQPTYVSVTFFADAEFLANVPNVRVQGTPTEGQAG